MLSTGLRRWYVNITLTILDILHRPVFYLEHGVSETRFCLRFQAELAQMSPIKRASLCLRSRDRIQSAKRHVLNIGQDNSMLIHTLAFQNRGMFCLIRNCAERKCDAAISTAFDPGHVIRY
jgi:hypothetical protein